MVRRRHLGLAAAIVAVAFAVRGMADLKSLGFTSMLGTSGLFYTAVMMGIRFFDGSYAAGGKFHALLPAGGAPVFDVKGSNPICFLVGCRRGLRAL